MNSTRGFALMEVIFYFAVLGAMSMLVVAVVGSGFNAWGQVRSERAASDGGKLILERLLQEVRLASSVNVAGSVLGTSPGTLSLNTFEQFDSEVPATLDVVLQDGTVTIRRNAETPVPLNGSLLRVSELIFDYQDNGNSELVRMRLTVEAGQGRFVQEQSFITAAVLRNSYANQ
ncbi:MAG: hypothetical protein Q7R48_02325 [bacterium]|nr:hypothetical protein [bacterium]